MANKINYIGVSITSLNILASVIFSYFLTHTLTNNSDALNLVANVFSILSGFLLLVITMSGENSSILTNMSDLDKANQEKDFLCALTNIMRFFALHFNFGINFHLLLTLKRKVPHSTAQTIIYARHWLCHLISDMFLIHTINFHSP